MTPGSKKTGPGPLNSLKKTDKRTEEVRKIADMRADVFARVLRGWLKDDAPQNRR